MADVETTLPPHRCPVFAPAALSAGLLWLSFFPLSLGFLAWVALVPFLSLVRADTTRRRRYLAAWLGGFLFFFAALHWVPFAHPMMAFAWVALAIYCSLYFPLGVFLVRRLDRAHVPLWLSVPAVWVGLEYFRAHFPSGFPWLEPLGLQHMVGFGWYFLGYTQHDYLPLIQIADVAGVYAVSLLVAAVNAVVFLWLWRLAVPAPTPRPVVGTMVVVSLITLAVGYGVLRLDHEPFRDGPRVALIQGNLPQSVKSERGATMADHFRRLCDEAASPQGEPRPDLIVWPETACPDYWFAPRHPLSPAELPELLQRRRMDLGTYVGERWKTNVLLGVNTIEWENDDREWKYNSALLIDGRGIPVARYDKMHLVPFGEYVPLRNLFPWLQAFTPYKDDYSCEPGTRWTRFPLSVGDRVYRFAVLICYEDTDPALARRYARSEGADDRVDFLVNISNDGWFDGTAEHEEHLAVCRFRAVEARKPVARAVNMGISGVVDSDGRVVNLPGDSWYKSKKVEAVVRGTVPLDDRTSLYARLGDWLPLGCWGVLAVGLILGRSSRPTA